MPDSSKPESTSRRLLLKKVGAAGAVGVITNLPLVDFGKNEVGQGTYGITENKQWGNINLQFLVTEHKAGSWENHFEEIKKSIDEHDIIIPEYFPHEYEHLENNKTYGNIIKGFRDENILFNHVADYCFQTGKPMLLLDPAYNEGAVTYEAAMIAASGISGAAIGLIEGNMVMAAGLELLKREKVSRRKFLGNLLTEVAAPLVAGVIGGGSFWGTFSKGVDSRIDYRRVLVAEKIARLSNSLKPSNWLAIYPGTHTNKIMYYLNEPQEREVRYEGYEKLAETMGLKSLMMARYWQRENNVWVKKEVDVSKINN